MELDRLNGVLAHQQNILSKIALGDDISNVFVDICLAIEELIEDDSAKCSILSLKGDQLFHCSAPSLDPEYCQLINGVTIGAEVGSCGTAAYRKSRVVVDNIATSPLWKNFKDLASNFNLHSCWSTPIISTQAEVLGTFAIYYGYPKTPSSKDLELIDYFVHFSCIALEKKQKNRQLNQLIQDLQVSNAKFHAITQVMPDLALIISEDGVYVDIYGALENLPFLSKNELLNKNLNDVLPRDNAKPIMAVIEKTLASNLVQVFEYELEVTQGKLTFEGRTAPVAYYQQDGVDKKHVLWMARDITVRKKAEKKVKQLAYFDPLTNLPNRRLLTERLTLCVERINRSSKTGALLFLDIDNFKRINDSLGHSAGDKLLVELSLRLKSVVRASDTLARIGGDEFVVLLEYVGDNNEHANAEAAIVAQKLQQVLHEKFEIGPLAFQVSGSIGICLIENLNSSADSILQFADTAMYRAKTKGGNSYSFYDARLQTLLEKQAALESDIVRAIDSNEFCAYFQPQVDLFGKVIGGEALIRWNHPTKGLITPNEFIPVAEQFGLIQKLQNIVLQDVCRLINQLTSKAMIDAQFNLSINLSQNQFHSSMLKSELLTIINDAKVEPSRIKLEITESMLSHELEHTVSQMEELKQQGFTFSIDDFGTGYSCLSYLHAYPVKELKVDKSFIDNIVDNDSGLSIVETIINLAKNLNMQVVAEGVETAEQFEILAAHQIDAIQGYYIAKPMALDDYVVWQKKYALKI
ncbi:hypothetical protein NBRC116592_03020 [Colwellia sp. KU-HH00111]|uniref:sensor domain-containing phosphodiesterase n=1 Tax=Colwellia sp. KU-HH00111 TaxID=3127652 RepID=UPI003109F324